ncbi:MAG: protein-L-isoaspartate(D-aspartate) O-methyltransferase [Spirochaetia bacterium]
MSRDKDYQRIRELMVENQVQARGVHDNNVLSAMRKVPRHQFVPPELERESYMDKPLPIGKGQTISQPYIVGYMTSLLHLTGDEKVLEIGTGSGYQTALLAETAAQVFSIELIESLSKRSAKKLSNIGYTNIHFRTGDGFKGWPEQAPFDRVILTSAPPEIPDTLLNQLDPESGIMVAPEGRNNQVLYQIRMEYGRPIKNAICPVRFVPMLPQKD